MSKTAPPEGPLDVLWDIPALTWMILAGEVLAAVLALSSTIDEGRWSYFVILSLGVQWVLLFTLVLLGGALLLVRVKSPPRQRVQVSE